jgi:glucose-1-phosphate thymidylyltransferase
MKAVVLAAGEAKRLRPLTAARPKGMLPVADRPLLEHVVAALAETEVEEVILVVGYRRERIQGHFEDGGDWGVRVRYVEQSSPRGTGDALLQAEPFVDGPFLAVNGDRVVARSAFERTAERLRATDAEATMAVTPDDTPSRHGVVSVEGDRIVDLVEKPPPHAVDSNVVNVGVYGFRPSVFGMLREGDQRGEHALTDALANYLDSHRIEAVHYDGLWPQLDYLWDVLTANATMLELTGTTVATDASVAADATVEDPVTVEGGTVVKPGARIRRDTVISESVSVGANAVLTNTVVLPNATIGPGTVLSDCVVGEGAELGVNVTAGGGRTDVVAEGAVFADVKLGGVIGDNATVGDGATIVPGTTIGNRTTVAPGATVSGEYPDDSSVVR